jgi:hypothetical protein
VAELVAVFRQVRRVLRPDGVLWLELGDSYAGGGYSNHNPDVVGGARRAEPPDLGRSPSRLRRPRGLADGGKQTHTPSQRKPTTTTGPDVPASWSNRSQPQRSLSVAGAKAKDLIGLPWTVALALRDDGWYLRSCVIWAKPNPMPESVTDRPTAAHSYVFLLAKQATYFYDAAAIAEPATYGYSATVGGAMWSGAGTATSGPTREPRRVIPGTGGFRNARTVWTIAPQPFSEAHFATFSEALAERCILAGSRPGDVVLDPFSGAGTVALVAKRLERRAIGIELNPAYQEMAIRRLPQEVLGLFTSGNTGGTWSDTPG